MQNQNISEFQTKFPLSTKRKFWKKMIVSVINSILPLLPILLVVSVIVFFGNGTNKLPTSGNMTAFFFFIIGFIILYLICLIPRGVYIKAYIKRYYYDCSEDFVTIKKGVFAPAEIHVQYRKIQDVYVDQDVLDRIMGLYDVHIASATSGSAIEAHIDGVDETSATEMKNFLLSKIKNSDIQSTPGTSSFSNTEPSVKPVMRINLIEDVSDKTYPINFNWFIMTTINKAISISLFYIFIFVPFIVGLRLFKFSLSIYVLCVIVLSIVWSINSLRLWRKNFSFSFNPDFIYIKNGVFSIHETHIPYNTIQDATLSRGVVERLFGLSSVIIRNAAGLGISNIVIPGQTIDKSQKIIEVLNSITTQKGSSSTGI